MIDVAPSLRISVAMCTFNGERYLPQQLESILAQQRPVYELVICDDGSVDTTESIVADFSRRAPFPVRFFRNPTRLGSSKNFERAIELCRGDLIALADQDDVWFADKTRKMQAVFEQDSLVGGIFTDAVLIDSASTPTGGSLWTKFIFSPGERALLAAGQYVNVLLRRPVVTGATFMFRASLRSSLLPIPSPWIHDAWLSWKVAMLSRLVHLDQPLMAYRTHAAQQIGVPPALTTQLRRLLRIAAGSQPLTASRSRALTEYTNHLSELQQLLREMQQLSLPHAEQCRSISSKASFYEAILHSFGESRFARLRFSLFHLWQYQRYSLLGWRTGLRDAIL